MVTLLFFLMDMYNMIYYYYYYPYAWLNKKKILLFLINKLFQGEF
jgi:hypothetical protein